MPDHVFPKDVLQDLGIHGQPRRDQAPDQLDVRMLCHHTVPVLESSPQPRQDECPTSKRSSTVTISRLLGGSTVLDHPLIAAAG